MAGSPVRDVRQGDLFRAPPPPARPVRRAIPPKPVEQEALPSEPVSRGRLGTKATRPEIDAFLAELPDQELAYLAVEATRLVQRRLARGQGRGLRSKGTGQRSSPLDEALRRIGHELMEAADSGETW